jgi:hypothetical protein
MLITRRRMLGRSIAALALLVLAGCGSSARTSVTQVWKAPVRSAPTKSIVVFAVHMDEANRRALEDAYVAALAKHDVAAQPSYAIFPGEPPPREKAQEVVTKAGVDGILVSKLRSVREKQTSVPSSAGGGFWSGYYGSGWAAAGPSYLTTDEIVSVDTTLWDARSGDRLLFAISTDTTNPSAGKAFVASVVKSVVSALEKQEIVSPKRESE